MNIQINTEEKTITVIEAKAEELIDLLERYKDFKVVSYVNTFQPYDPYIHEPFGGYDPNNTGKPIWLVDPNSQPYYSVDLASGEGTTVYCQVENDTNNSNTCITTTDN